MQDQLAEFIFY